MLKSVVQHVSVDVMMDIFSPSIVSGSVSRSFVSMCYQLPVLDTIFVRKKHRGKDLGLMMLEDYVDSFTEDALGLRYPLSTFMCTGKFSDLFVWSSLCFLYAPKLLLSLKPHICGFILSLCQKFCSSVKVENLDLFKIVKYFLIRLILCVRLNYWIFAGSLLHLCSLQIHSFHTGLSCSCV